MAGLLTDIREQPEALHRMLDNVGPGLVPIQLLATRLALRRGIEPGKFRFIQKVTVTE